MKTNKIIILTVLSFIFLIEVACATKQPSTKLIQNSLPTETSLSPKPEKSPRLYEYLSSSGVKSKKVGQAEVITALDVYCKAVLPDGNRVCTFKNGTHNYIVSKQASEPLADLLFGLNLSQGDSGVFATFIECSKYGSKPVSYGCNVAIPLDYEKP